MADYRIWFPDAPTGAIDNNQRSEVAIGYRELKAIDLGTTNRIWFPDLPTGVVDANQRSELAVGFIMLQQQQQQPPQTPPTGTSYMYPGVPTEIPDPRTYRDLIEEDRKLQKYNDNIERMKLLINAFLLIQERAA